MRLSRELGVLILAAGVTAAGQTVAPEAAQSGDPAPAVRASYKPIVPEQRWKWAVRSTIGPESLAGGVVSAAFGTAVNSPKEYGGSWKGFGKRYGMRFTGVATQNAMEAGLGEITGEDPRYFRASGRPFGDRVLNIVKMTFLARHEDGSLGPAYARYAAIGGSNFLSNTWRADSEANTRHALERTVYGFLGRMAGNAFQEFWPDVRWHIWKKKH